MTHPRHSFQAAVVVAFLTLVAGAKALADVSISDSSNFGLSGTCTNWDSMATFHSNRADFRVESVTDCGGGWHVLTTPIDGSGYDSRELQLDVYSASIADFNVVLIDSDGTERVYRYDSLVAGADQSISKDLADYLQVSAPGSTSYLGIANHTVIRLQDRFAYGSLGLVQDLTFDKAALLTTIPEAASVALLALAELTVETTSDAAGIRFRQVRFEGQTQFEEESPLWTK